MFTIINKSNNPYYNLAFEEYVLKNIVTDEDIILLWRNEPTVVVGRNQNTYEEINYDYLLKNNINVVRRISGGGAVYHDLGNINFTFITNTTTNSFAKLAIPIIKALKTLGINATFSGRNDILVNDKKFSGNAQYFYKKRMFQHGTLLFDTNLNMIPKVLNLDPSKVMSKGIKSYKSRVTNIKPLLSKPINIDQFMEYLLKFILKTEDISKKVLTLNEKQKQDIIDLMNNKYLTWEWNFGKSPQSTITKRMRFTSGKIVFHLLLKEGIIKSCKIEGDFFGKKDVCTLEELLINTPYTQEAIIEKLSKVDIDEYFLGLSLPDLITCLFAN